MKIQFPAHLKGGDLARHLVANKHLLFEQKKSAIKKADAVSFMGGIVDRSGNTFKEGTGIEQEDGSLKNTTVINSCLWYDSHGDVHIPKIWNKSLSDNAKMAVNKIMLLQEHLLKFDKIIADKGNVIPYTKTLTWKQLGVDFPGETECLIFDNTITPKRNPYMYNQYKDGNVTNHSVGMYYVDIAMAIWFKDKEFAEYNKTWDKYIDLIPNSEEAKEAGMFFAIKEAKVIEGSAVPIGSNIITPTYDNSFKGPNMFTPDEPDQSTRKSIFTTINKIF